MKYFSFAFKHCQYPLLLSLFSFFQIFSGFKIPYTESFLISILMCLSPIPYLFVEFISCFLKRKTRQEVSTSERFALSTRSLPLLSRGLQFNYMIILYLFLLAIISVFPYLIFFGYISNQMMLFSNLNSFIGLFVTSLLSYFFVKRKLMRHQLLGLAIILTDVIIYYSVLYNHKAAQISLFYYDDTSIFFFFLFVYIIPVTLREVLEKHLMHFYYISPFLLLFIEGILSITILITLSFIPDTVCDSIENNYLFILCFTSRWNDIVFQITSFFTMEYEYFNYALTFFILSIITILLRIQTNKILSPSHNYICELLFSFYYIIFIYYIHLFELRTIIPLKALVIEIVQIPIIFIAFCIYNEYIIIHKWDLDIDTTNNIIQRSKEETEEINTVFEEGGNVIAPVIDDSESNRDSLIV